MTEQLTKHIDTHSAVDTVPLLRVRDAAAILGISPKTVNKLVREKKLSCVQITPRERRFTREQIQEYIQSQSTSVHVDKKDPRPVQSPLKTGGLKKKSAGDIGTDLVKEIRSLCR